MLSQLKKAVLRAAETVVRRWGSVERDPSPDFYNHQMVGLTDAVKSGWYLSDSAELVEGMAISSADTVIDVGCGDGLATHFCARHGAHVVFTDIDPNKVEGVRQLVANLGARKLEGIVSDTSPLPFADGYGTKILAMEMLEHTRNPEAILKELVRVGRSGAQYLITVPDARSEQVQQPFADASYFREPNHIQVFSKEEFVRLVENAGLIVESYRTWGFYWTFWWCLNWLEGKRSEAQTTLDSVPGTTGSSLDAWSKVWGQILDHSGTEGLVNALNNALPKSQAIVARKP